MLVLLQRFRKSRSCTDCLQRLYVPPLHPPLPSLHLLFLRRRSTLNCQPERLEGTTQALLQWCGKITWRRSRRWGDWVDAATIEWEYAQRNGDRCKPTLKYTQHPWWTFFLRVSPQPPLSCLLQKIHAQTITRTKALHHLSPCWDRRTKTMWTFNLWYCFAH